MRRGFLWASLVLASIVLVGILLQLYFIAAWVFGASGALDAHKTLGSAVVWPAEVLVFLVAFGAWWRRWRQVGWAFALAVVGSVQILLVGDLAEPGNGWVHGLHGGLVLVVVALATYVCHREARALGLMRPRAPQRV